MRGTCQNLIKGKEAGAQPSNFKVIANYFLIFFPLSANSARVLPDPGFIGLGSGHPESMHRGNQAIIVEEEKS